MAPDPKSMLEIVSEVPNALGLIPSSWLETQTTTHNARAIPLIQGDIEVDGVLIDVLAVTEPDPDKDVRTLLICVQQSSN
jgi:hypothetical protein